MGALGMPLSGGILVPTCAIYSSTEGPASRPARLLGVRVENRAAALTLTNQPTNYLYTTPASRVAVALQIINLYS